MALFEAEDGTRYTFNQWTGAFSLVLREGEAARFTLYDTGRFDTLIFALSGVEEGAGVTVTVENQTGVIQTEAVGPEWQEYGYDIAGSEFVSVAFEGQLQEGQEEMTLTLTSHTDSLK